MSGEFALGEIFGRVSVSWARAPLDEPSGEFARPGPWGTGRSGDDFDGAITAGIVDGAAPEGLGLLGPADAFG